MNDKEEEVVELAEQSVGEKLHAEYVESIQSCSNYFETISTDLDTITSGYVDFIIKRITSAKKTLLLKEKDAYSNLKIQLFNVLDTGVDVQLEVSSAQERLGKGAEKINRYLAKKNDYYYSNKYQARTLENCKADQATVG